MDYKSVLAQFNARNQAMCALREADPLKWTFILLGAKYGVTGQRAQAICKKGKP